VKDEHTYSKKIARNGCTKSIYKGTFVSKQSLVASRSIWSLWECYKPRYVTKREVLLLEIIRYTRTCYFWNFVAFTTYFYFVVILVWVVDSSRDCKTSSFLCLFCCLAQKEIRAIALLLLGILLEMLIFCTYKICKSPFGVLIKITLTLIHFFVVV
jgi:hypothetical protein